MWKRKGDGKPYFPILALLGLCLPNEKYLMIVEHFGRLGSKAHRDLFDVIIFL